MADKAAARSRKPPARFDDESGCWLVPMSDSELDLHSGEWSPPVQFRAVTTDGGDSYTLRVRPA